MSSLLAHCAAYLEKLAADYHDQIFTCMAMVAILLIVVLAIELLITVRVEDLEPEEPKQ